MFRTVLSLFLLLPFIAACNLDTAQEATDVAVSTDVAVPTSEVTLDPVVFFVVSEDERIEARRVGCDTFIVPRSTGGNRGGDPAENIRNALQSLVTMTTGDLALEGQTNDFADQNLTVNSVTVEDDLAIVEFRGTMMLAGVCSDALYTAQILHTIFENAPVNRARVLVEGHNLQEIMSGSGLPVPADSVYTRDEVLTPS